MPEREDSDRLPEDGAESAPTPKPKEPRRRKRRWPWLLSSVALLAVIGLLIANSGYYLGSAYSGELCARCHVIRKSTDLWRISSHRNVACTECHGSALTLDPREHQVHWQRLYLQLTDQLPPRVVLKDAQVDRLLDRCAGCHQDAFARWSAGGHSMRYADVFLNRTQNAATQLNDDCLRCHGMFFDGGGIASLVTPISTEGPWQMVRPEFGDRPSIPCLACHQIHRAGEPARRPDYAEPGRIAVQRRIETSSLGFFDRRDRSYRGDEHLPLPQMEDRGVPVRMSPDPRQSLCYQCHAPHPDFQVASGDDRTPFGVHEGISCIACHAAHSLDARASCKTCHPRLSNCGLDVERMDTSFYSANSAHNIHFVKCSDCHRGGVPATPGPSRR